jgi:hypothetical protein
MANIIAAIPTAALVDASGNVTPSWRAFFQVLQERTGGTVGQQTPDIAALEQAQTTETAARTGADAAFNTELTAETNARIAADNGKYDKAGGTIGGNIGFYGHGAAGRPTVTGSKAGNAALGSLLAGLAGLGLVNDTST